MKKLAFQTFLLTACLYIILGCAPASPTMPATPPVAVPVAQQDTFPFPIYLTFKEFEPYLQKTGDTVQVINFWATWCQPCVAELPWFQQLIQAYEGQPVKIWLVSMDFPKDIRRKLLPFVKERGIEANVVCLADLDYNAWIEKVSKEWDGAIPFTLVYNGRARTVKFGELDSYEALKKMVETVARG